MLGQQQLPTFTIDSTLPYPHTLTLLLPSESHSIVPQQLLQEFQQTGIAAHSTNTYLIPKQVKKYTITSNCNL